MRVSPHFAGRGRTRRNLLAPSRAIPGRPPRLPSSLDFFPYRGAAQLSPAPTATSLAPRVSVLARQGSDIPTVSLWTMSAPVRLQQFFPKSGR